MTPGKPNLFRLAAAAVCLALTVGFSAMSSEAQNFASPAPIGPASTGASSGAAPKHGPRSFSGGADLPNGWRVTPAGKTIGVTGDLVTNLISSPDGRVVIAMNSGWLPHGLTVFDTKTQKEIQKIALPSAWLGMAWSSDGRTLYVSGGNASGASNKANPVAPIYEFTYTNGRLSDAPVAKLTETIDPKLVWWSGVAFLPSKNRLYAANRGTGTGPGSVVVFDTRTGQIVTRIPVETTPYQTVLSPDGKLLFVSNWSSQSVSVIDASANQVIRTLRVGMNPNDMKLSSDGRLFVACSNDNTVHVIDTRALRVIERLSTTLTQFAPEGSTPDALTIDDRNKLLYIANADNNSIAVVRIDNRAHSTVAGFIPSGWYPSALALADRGQSLYIGNTKGNEGHPDPGGPTASWPNDPHKGGSVHSLQTGSIEVAPVAELKEKLPLWTRRVMENTPYNDSLLYEARKPLEASIIPQRVGEPGPIRHIIYIIKENRTYDQVFGDLPHANGERSLTLFGEKVTPNQHALAKEYVTLDNLYCDGEVSMDGHSWSNSAYATDFNEKQWPELYAARSNASYDVPAMVPSAGHLWDLAKRKGLTYRSYGENAARASTATPMEAAPGSEGLVGHVAKDYIGGIDGDEGRLEVFLREFRQYEANYDSPDPEKRLPNYIVMSIPGDHTMGTTPGHYKPAVLVARNDYVVGQLVEAVSHSRYWPNTAIFIIEDDAQDGADHVDARRTIGLVISPYVRRGIVDSTLYMTSSMVRSIELLLGLPPMSQYDAAATPMYASFGANPLVKPFTAIKPLIDVNEMNTPASPGAKESARMDFSDVDRAPMRALNEVVWKSVRGPDSIMPPPVHRFRPIIDASEQANDDDDDVRPDHASRGNGQSRH